MPRGDRTGPFGEGPKTGRQLGFCADYDHPGYARSPGWGLGRGFFRHGVGRGRGFFRSRPLDDWLEQGYTTDEVDALRSDVRELKDKMALLMDQIDKLAPKKESK